MLSPQFTVTDDGEVVNVGAVVSITKVLRVSVVEFPDASVNVTVSPEYVPSLNSVKVIVLADAVPLVDVLNPSEQVIVPASLEVITTFGVLSLFGVPTAVVSVSVGGVLSISSNNPVENTST